MPNNSSVFLGIDTPDDTAEGGWVKDAIAVNNQTSGSIYILSGSQVNIKFYAWAQGNQMPVRRVVMDKGDGQQVVNEGTSIGNRKPKCASKGVCYFFTGDTDASRHLGYQYPCETSEDCKPVVAPADTTHSCTTEGITDLKSFGSTEETGCKDLPWEFSGDYICPAAGMEMVDKIATDYTLPSSGSPCQCGYVSIPGSSSVWACSGTCINWDKIEDDYGFTPAFVCVAQPKVQVLDNWGWCTGSCSTDGDYGSNTTIKGSGCYSEMVNPKKDDCGFNDPIWKKPWVSYNGYVVVVPMP